MLINTRRGPKCLVRFVHDSEKVIRSNAAGPGTIQVEAEAGDGRPMGRNENTSIGTEARQKSLQPLRRPDK